MRLFSFSFFAMACENELQLYAATEKEAGTAAQAVIDEVKRIETKYSRYLPDSVVSRINASAGVMPVAIDPETDQLLDYAHTCFAQSEGMFDITSGVLRRAWNFRAAKPPQPGEIEPLLALIGWQKVRRERDTVYLPAPGMEIDFGGFGKEYAVDRATYVMAINGIQHGFVNLGGDLAVLGCHADGKPWGVGIRHPRMPGALLATLPLYSGAIATSGDYERFFEFEGRRYCHILDPRTGQPVAGLQSVTVNAPSCLVAGSAATIAMLKGEGAGVAWLDRVGLAYLCVRGNGTRLNTFYEPVISPQS